MEMQLQMPLFPWWLMNFQKNAMTRKKHISWQTLFQLFRCHHMQGMRGLNLQIMHEYWNNWNFTKGALDYYVATHQKILLSSVYLINLWNEVSLALPMITMAQLNQILSKNMLHLTRGIFLKNSSVTKETFTSTI